MRRSAVALLAALSLLAACGDDGDEGSADTTTPELTETTGPPATEPPGGDGPVLVAYGTSFGMCFGFCTRTVAFEGPTASLTATTNEGEERRALGTLTDEGVAALADVLEGLDPNALQPVYGCPDCADGGAARVVLTDGGGPLESTYDFGGPPPELAALDTWGATVLDALVTCQANELVEPKADCEPLPT